MLSQKVNPVIQVNRFIPESVSETFKVVLTFESVDEILWYDHSNKTPSAVLSCGDVYYAVQGGSNF